MSAISHVGYMASEFGLRRGKVNGRHIEGQNKSCKLSTKRLRACLVPLSNEGPVVSTDSIKQAAQKDLS